MADKFIPDPDGEFREMAGNFARVIERDPGRFKLSAEDAAIISRAVTEFDRAMRAVTNKGVRSSIEVMAKDKQRIKTERVIRRYGNRIRVDDSISAIDKGILRIKERPAKLKRRRCPQTRPLLLFRGAKDATPMSGPVHILEFVEELGTGTRAKPAGAARVEVYVELVDEGEPIPKHPGELSGGRPWYLRSFTRTPMEVEVPVCSRPMLVVYWARWADAKGNVGPFSRTCMARVEGWSGLHAALPDPMQARQRQQRIIITSARRELPEPVERVEEIEVREAKLLEEAA